MNSNPSLVLGAELDCVRQLLQVTELFIRAQQQRHIADYDDAKTWVRTEVLSLIDKVTKAFKIWREIRDEPIAQDYVLSLLGNPKTN